MLSMLPFATGDNIGRRRPGGRDFEFKPLATGALVVCRVKAAGITSAPSAA